MSRAGVFLSSQFRLVILMTMSIGMLVLTSDVANANQGWGGSQGGYASSGGSMGCSGGRVARCMPVRNLLGRICGCFSNHRANRIARRNQRFGSSGGFVGGSSGGWVGCSGGFMSSGGTTGWGSPMVMSNVVTLNPSPTMPGYFDPNCCGVYPGSVPAGVPTETSVLDGGSIDSMLDGGSQPAESPEYYNAPTQPKNGDGGVPTPGPTGGADERTSTGGIRTNSAVLNLVLPTEAKVYINDQLTQTEGDHRSYVSRNLNEDRDYDYRVKAVLTRGGKEYVRTQMVKMRPGLNKTVEFNFSEPALTTLELNVPENAKVTLCGNPTSATGSARIFSTATLKEGQVWKDYSVRVEYEQDGETKTDERSFDLLAGETYQLTMGSLEPSAGDRVASR